MNHAAPALTDLARLTSVASYDLDDLALRAELDALCERTALAVGMPVSMVSVVLDGAVFVAGSHGLPDWVREAGGIPAEWSLCPTVVVTRHLYLVEDAKQHPDHADNPFVALDALGCYAGVPVLSPDGQALGAHCVLGPDRRQFSAEDVRLLTEATAEATRVLGRYRSV